MKKAVCLLFVILLICSCALALTACKKEPIVTWSYNGASGDTMTEEEFWEQVGDQQDLMLIYKLNFGTNNKRFEAKGKRFVKELGIDQHSNDYYVSLNSDADWVVVIFFSKAKFDQYRAQLVDNAESRYFGEIIVTVSMRTPG